MKEKRVVLLLTALLLSSFVISFVNAAKADDAAAVTSGVLDGGLNWLGNQLSPLFGNQEILTRIFFAILIFLIIQQIIVKLFPSNSFVSNLAAVIITLLSLIALPANFIKAILTNYGAMGAAILSIIPFIILLVFTVKVSSKLIAQLLWIFYMAYYLLLYTYRIVTVGGGFITAETIPYIGALIVGLIIFLFIGKIRKLWMKGELSASEETAIRGIKFRNKGRKLMNEETKGLIEGGEGI